MEAGIRIGEEVKAKGSALVLGLDPRPSRMPEEYRGRGRAGITAFHAELLGVCAPFVVAVKVQIAFFEVLGEEGLAAYAETCRLAREAGLAILGDVKRGDIGSTAEAYAEIHYRWADWLTLHPWLGRDSVEPFLRRCGGEGKGAFVLVATSNPSWEEFQGVPDGDGRPMYLRVAAAVADWNEECAGPDGYGPVGAVVGATHPEVHRAVRAALPRSWLLMPGVGAQGARIGDLGAAFDAEGLGVLLPVSRGLAACFEPGDPDWRERVRARAEELRAELRAAVPALAGGR